jgi:hypothetical protein
VATWRSNRQSEGRQSDDVHPAAQDRRSEGAMGEGIAIDAEGNVYTAEANLRGVTKYAK